MDKKRQRIVKKLRKEYEEAMKKPIDRMEVKDLMKRADGRGVSYEELSQGLPDARTLFSSKIQPVAVQQRQAQPTQQEQLPYVIVDRQDIRTEPRMDTFIRREAPVQPQVPQNVHQHPSEGLKITTSRSIGMEGIDDPWLQGRM